MVATRRSAKSADKTGESASPNASVEASSTMVTPGANALERFYMGLVRPFVHWAGHDVPPGPHCAKVRYVINFQKGGTGPFVMFLMWYFGNYSLGPFVYLSLHGTYGVLWLLKEAIHPDPQWQQPCTIPSLFSAFGLVLGPYWYIAYLAVSDTDKADPSYTLCAACIFVHTIGCVLMMASDCQKYYTLKFKKGLISDGWFYNCRNTNYLGEIMLYGSYAAIARRWEGWCVLFYVWSVLFASNMIAKEISLRKKDGYEEYRRRSGVILPKIF